MIPDTVIVVQVLECEKHPNGDRLQICRVDDGSGEPRQIVCGALNCESGMKTALALPGTVLGGDFEIRPASIRGVESFGMLCSEKELGIGGANGGIMELPAFAPVGAQLSEYLEG